MLRALVLAATCLAAAACGAEKPYLTLDDLEPDLPRRSLADALAALPAPSTGGAFLFAADVEDVPTHDIVGHVRIAVEASKYEGDATWFVDSTIEDLHDHSQRHDVAFLSPHLRRHHPAFLPGTAFPVPAPIEVTPEFHTLAVALLFFRLCPADSAMYVAPGATPDHLTLRRKADELVGGVPGPEAWTIHLDPGDRAIRGIDEFRIERSPRRYVVR